MSNVTIGIEAKDNYIYAARVEDNTGRKEVKALLRFEKDKFSNHKLLDNGKIVFAIDDQLVTKKYITVDPTNISKQESALFELRTASGDNQSDIFYDLIETALENQFIGYQLRKENLTNTIWSLFENKIASETIGPCRVRSAALAKGFIEYCRPLSGDLSALVEISSNQLILALLNGGKIVDLSSLVTDFDIFENISNFKKLAVELKTTINFKISSLFDKGISVPLANLVVCGEFIDDEKIDCLREYFKLNISRPEINRGFFPDQDDKFNIPLDKYIIALGLTVD